MLQDYIEFSLALADVAARYRAPKHASTLLKLTDALCSLPTEDYYGASARDFASNFLTRKTITAKSIYFGGTHPENVEGEIALIECADTGFDWIFAHDLARIITKYGVQTRT
jgi:hypothetical protein